MGEGTGLGYSFSNHAHFSPAPPAYVTVSSPDSCDCRPHFTRAREEEQDQERAVSVVMKSPNTRDHVRVSHTRVTHLLAHSNPPHF